MRCDRLGDEISAKYEVEGRGLPDIEARGISHEVRLRPRSPPARCNVARTGGSHGVEIEYQQPMLGNHFANVDERSAQIDRRNPEVGLSGHAKYVRPRQVVAGTADHLRLEAFAIELDIVGRRHLASCKQSVEAADLDRARSERNATLGTCVRVGAVERALISILSDLELALPVLVAQRNRPI